MVKLFKCSNYRLNLGFSLIELMVVIGIIAILTTVLMPSYVSYMRKSNLTKVVNSLSAFQLELTDTYLSDGTWPTTLNGVAIDTDTADTSFPFVQTFYYNASSNKAWFGYKLSAEYGDGWLYMLLIYNGSVFEIHCGARSSDCTDGSCNSYDFFPSECNEQDLGTTYGF